MVNHDELLFLVTLCSAGPESYNYEQLDHQSVLCMMQNAVLFMNIFIHQENPVGTKRNKLN